MAQALMVSLAHWRDELREIETAPAGDVRKQHLLASLDQARQSLKQLLERSMAAEGPE